MDMQQAANWQLSSTLQWAGELGEEGSARVTNVSPDFENKSTDHLRLGISVSYKQGRVRRYQRSALCPSRSSLGGRACLKADILFVKKFKIFAPTMSLDLHRRVLFPFTTF